ncbi:hypothetical protein KIPB_004284 [Kipferlia bialata]|uniref:Uncharacterized protein n=1 Tax=Kipferlia bialata TaxID=797122 RepID=A0A9K3GHN5_9EUKA|nr:hypothetical protein KIPB_004284 [Kipferlia bialata]|eukprot:g4284.t1
MKDGNLYTLPELREVFGRLLTLIQGEADHEFGQLLFLDNYVRMLQPALSADPPNVVSPRDQYTAPIRVPEDPSRRQVTDGEGGEKAALEVVEGVLFDLHGAVLRLAMLGYRLRTDRIRLAAALVETLEEAGEVE